MHRARFSRSNPMSFHFSFSSERPRRPAATRAARHSAICTVTRSRGRRRRPAITDFVCALRMPFKSPRAACAAGARPKRRAVRSDSRLVYASTRGSRWRSKALLASRPVWNTTMDGLGHDVANRQPRGAADERQHAALDQVLAEEARAGRAERQTHRGLAPPAHRAREQQVRHVRADDEEQHADEEQQNPQGVDVAAVEGIDAAAARQSNERGNLGRFDRRAFWNGKVAEETPRSPRRRQPRPSPASAGRPDVPTSSDRSRCAARPEAIERRPWPRAARRHRPTVRSAGRRTRRGRRRRCERQRC